jgi:hypothetical protein
VTWGRRGQTARAGLTPRGGVAKHTSIGVSSSSDADTVEVAARAGRSLLLPAGAAAHHPLTIQESDMSVATVVMVCLMAFVLLAPTMMVAVLVSGLSRRAVPAAPTGAPTATGVRTVEPQVALQPAA